VALKEREKLEDTSICGAGLLLHAPDYFGKNGFTSPQSLHRHENTINLKKVDEIARTSQGEKT